MKTHLFLSSNVSKILFIGVLSLFLNTNSVAQNTEKTTLSNINLYADVGMHYAGQMSINLEKRIFRGEKLTWYGRAGFGATGVLMIGGGPGGLAAITMLTGKGKNHFEINGGAFFAYSDAISVLPLFDLGYRHQKPEGGFLFKAKIGILGVGIGLGYAF